MKQAEWKKWTIKRDDDGYFYWEHEDGTESPIFCVKALADRWIENLPEMIISRKCDR